MRPSINTPERLFHPGTPIRLLLNMTIIIYAVPGFTRVYVRTMDPPLAAPPLHAPTTARLTTPSRNPA